MAEKDPLDRVHQDAIHVETIKKEQRLQKLHTEFKINSYRKLHILADKPTSTTPQELLAVDDSDFTVFHKTQEVPTQKYLHPITESHEIGWISTPLSLPSSQIPSNRHDRRFHFSRLGTDVTRHQEMALRKSGPAETSRKENAKQ